MNKKANIVFTLVLFTTLEKEERDRERERLTDRDRERLLIN